VQIEFAEVSLIGHREDNQDRCAVAVAEHAAMLVIIDGMGGHADGARAAEVARKSLLDSFWAQSHPLFDPLGFLHLALGRAHDDVVSLGTALPIEQRPRATCAICLVQEGSAYWAHVGDSRVYHLRNGRVRARTRDHSHVEQLLRDGAISEDQVQGHPMRNYVECCLGGDPTLPEMSLSRRRSIQAGDVLLACTDGLWAGTRDADIAASLGTGSTPLRQALEALAAHSVLASAPHSDNTTAVALRWLGPAQ
jgi:serine/threonine protein phosphatase PrpC